MILICDACSAQNFVSPERRAVGNPPPGCWKCGAPLPIRGETGPATRESNQRAGDDNASGGVGDA